MIMNHGNYLNHEKRNSSQRSIEKAILGITWSKESAWIREQTELRLLNNKM